MKMNINKKIRFNGHDYLLVGYSVQGNEKDQNQDSLFYMMDSQSIVICIADGLGSATFSKEGAEFASKIMAELLLNNDDLNDIHMAFLEKWKTKVGDRYELYDSTIRFVKIKTNQISYGGIGDGWTGIKCNNSYVHWTYDHTFINQTDSIMTLGYIEKFINRTIVTDDFQRCILATDGFSEDIEESMRDNLIEKMGDLALKNSLDFMNQLEIQMKNWPIESNQDDKTVVLIVRI